MELYGLQEIRLYVLQVVRLYVLQVVRLYVLQIISKDCSLSAVFDFRIHDMIFMNCCLIFEFCASLPLPTSNIQFFTFTVQRIFSFS